MTESLSSKNEDSPSPIKSNHATAAAIGTLVGMLLPAIIAIALWQPLAITPLINALVFGYRLTGNLGIAILLLSIVLNGLSLMRGCSLWFGTVLTLLSGLIFPAGAVLFWLGGQLFWFIKLWQFPLTVVND